MSGIEVAGLVIGVVPIFIEIIKSYGHAREKLGTFKRYHQAVCEIQLDFRLEEKTFRDECHHLLVLVVEEEQELQDMLQNANNHRWHDRNLESRFQTALGNDYGICEEVVIKIRDILRETTDDLIYLGKISEAAEHKESPADTFKHLWHAFNVSAKENRYKQRLQDLRNWNAKFRRLRKQNCGLPKPRQFSSSTVLIRRLPASFSKIREASKTLHASLDDAWSCSNISHEAHQAKLWLDAKAGFDAVRLDMAISCRQRERAPNQRYSESPLWLYVQSLTTKVESADPVPISMPVVSEPSPASYVHQNPTPSPSKAQSKTASILSGMKRCKKRVRFSSDAPMEDNLGLPVAKFPKPQTAEVDLNSQCHSMQDLRRTKSFCCHLKDVCAASANLNASCLGFLEAQNSLRFIFYDAGKRESTKRNQQGDFREAQPLNSTLSSLLPLQRLELAHKISTAVLQYYLTPWLPEDWRLQDLSFFGDEAHSTEDDLAEKLQTLHLSTQFPKSIPSRTALLNDSSSQEPVKGMRINTTHRYTYGIKNMTLAKLGVALLEIGHKKDISSFKLDQPHDVINARILADGAYTELGPRYHKIAQKLIDCSFPSSDLDTSDLQTAVFSEVVCELGDMMESYKSFWCQSNFSAVRA